MILRLWRGWTAPGDADAFEALIRSTIFPGIVARKIDGLLRLDLARHDGDGDGETEFMTLMWFADREGVVRFAGPDWETSVVPLSARAVLSRFDPKVAHYDTRIALQIAPHV
jgi:hypothetical protein